MIGRLVPRRRHRKTESHPAKDAIDLMRVRPLSLDEGRISKRAPGVRFRILGTRGNRRQSIGAQPHGHGIDTCGGGPQVRGKPNLWRRVFRIRRATANANLGRGQDIFRINAGVGRRIRCGVWRCHARAAGLVGIGRVAPGGAGRTGYCACALLTPVEKQQSDNRRQEAC